MVPREGTCITESPYPVSLHVRCSERQDGRLNVLAACDNNDIKNKLGELYLDINIDLDRLAPSLSVPIDRTNLYIKPKKKQDTSEKAMRRW